MLAEAWLLQDDLDQAATALGRPPDTFRDTVSSGRLVDALAAARTSRVCARRSIARHRPSRARAEAGRSRARLARHRPRPLRARRTAIGASATRRSSASTSPRPRRRFTQPAIGAISRSSTRCRASCSPRSVSTTRRWVRCATPSVSPRSVQRRRRPCDGLRQPGRRDDDGAPLRAGARARRAKRRAPRRHAIRATGSPWPWPRSVRSASASATSRAPRTPCTARSMSGARFSSTRRRAPSSTPSPRST